MDHLSTLPFVPPVLWHALLPSGRAYVAAVRTCNETCRDIIRRRQAERADPKYGHAWASRRLGAMLLGSSALGSSCGCFVAALPEPWQTDDILRRLSGDRDERSG